MLHFIEVKATNTATSAIYRITPDKDFANDRVLFFAQRNYVCL